MPCIVCDGYIWICSDDDDLDCDTVDLPPTAPTLVLRSTCGNDWCYKGCGFYEEGEYRLWFLAGAQYGNCDALMLPVGQNPPTPNPNAGNWKTVGDPQQLGPGHFELWCKKGGGGGGGGNPPFWVAARAVLACPAPPELPKDGGEEPDGVAG